MKHRGDPGPHRAPQPGRRRATPVGKRRADVRPRYGRIAVLAAALTVSGISVLGGFGVLPNGPEDASAEAGLVTGTDPAAPADAGDPGDARDPARREATDRSASQPARVID